MLAIFCACILICLLVWQCCNTIFSGLWWMQVQMGFLSPSTIETARFLCEGILNNSYPSASIIVTFVVLKAVEFFMKCLPLDLFSISIAFTLAYLHLQYTLASYKVFFKEIRIERWLSHILVILFIIVTLKCPILNVLMHLFIYLRYYWHMGLKFFIFSLGSD